MSASKQVFLLLLLPVLFTLLLVNPACRKDDEGGKLTFLFEHKVKDSPLIKDSMIYMNTAQNQYEVNELQYFISDIIIWKQGGKHLLLSESGIHYVDIDLPSSLSWSPDQVFPAGQYDSISFTFGLSKEKNVPGYFVNPPERDMFWPEVMGGGYHYMKMNGKWMTPAGGFNPFNLHLGVGMTTDSTGNEVFIQNYFTVTFPLSNCHIHESQLYRIFVLNMDINSWFESPYNWDWNSIGGMIMQNQDAMHTAVRNGMDAFSITYDAPKPK